MKVTAMLNRLEMLRIFCAAAEARNFKEAAIRLGISPQAVTRAVKELEGHVGEVLFHRNTRRVQISEAGARLAMQAKASVAGVDGIFDRRRESPELVSGTVRITAPLGVGKDYLIPMLAELKTQHPGLHFYLRLTDLAIDVVEEQIDVGVRMGFLRDSRYVARAVAPVPFRIVGSPALIATYGEPTSLQELGEMPTIVSMDPNNGKAWPWFLANGQQWSPRHPAFAIYDTRAECDAVVAGLGFGQIPEFQAQPFIRAGRLIEVLPELAPDPWNLYVYRPQRGPVPARTRLVFDWLVKNFSDTAQFPQIAEPLASLSTMKLRRPTISASTKPLEE